MADTNPYQPGFFKHANLEIGVFDTGFQGYLSVSINASSRVW